MTAANLHREALERIARDPNYYEGEVLRRLIWQAENGVTVVHLDPSDLRWLLNDRDRLKGEARAALTGGDDGKP